MRTVILLQDYDDFAGGTTVEVESDADAARLVQAGGAKYTTAKADVQLTTEYNSIADDIEKKIRAELKAGSNSIRPFQPGGYAEGGFGPISPKIFFSDTGTNASNFSNAADFMRAITAASEGKWNPRLSNRQEKDISGDNEVTGGFCIPTGMANFIWSEMIENLPFLTASTLVPMEHKSVEIPAIYDVTRTDTSGIHGLTVPHGVGEGAALTDISPTFRSMELTLKKIAGRSRINNEWLEDAPAAMSTLLPRIFSEALTSEMYRQYLWGTGAGEMMGIMNSTALITQNKEVDQDADTIVTENIVQMYARLMPEAQKRAIWVANLNTLPMLLTMTVKVGTGGAYVWLVQGDRGGAGLAQSPPLSILGRPLYLTQYANTIGSLGDLLCFNPSAYAIGRKLDSTMRIETSRDVRFENDQTAYRCVIRIDGQSMQHEPVVPLMSTTTLSHFVTLQARD